MNMRIKLIIIIALLLSFQIYLKAEDSIKSIQFGLYLTYLKTPSNFFGIQVTGDQSSVFYPESMKKHKIDYTKWYNKDNRYNIGFSYDFINKITRFNLGANHGKYLRFGCYNVDYFEKNKSFIGVMPDIGLSYRYFEITYGYLFPLLSYNNKYDKYISKNTFSFSLIIPIYTRNLGKNDNEADFKKNKRKKRK
jgi:hypothetical protein